MKKNITIFTDGSSLGNPGRGGFGVVVVYDNNVFELGGSEKHTTNNRMEMTAVIEALIFVKKIKANNKLTIYTDSSYVINGITKWVYGWEKKNWMGVNKKEVLNKDLWMKLLLETKEKEIEWKHVRGHVGIAGNERADFLATMCASEQSFKKEKFFEGPVSKYPYDILNTKPNEIKSDLRAKTKSKKKSSSAKAYSYVSLVGGKFMRHKTWAECEKRVKGVPKTKFKKAFSKEDEISIAKEWGVK